MIRRLFLLMILSLCFTTLGYAEYEKNQAIAQFENGNAAYKKGDFQTAIQAYESILKHDWHSAPIYYNLANSYFRSGQLGKALLNYERAKRLAPRDSDIEFNYHYALGQNIKLQNQEPKGLFAKLYMGHIMFYSEEEMAWMIVSLFGFLGLCWLLALYFRWPFKLRVTLFSLITISLSIFVVGLMAKVHFDDRTAVVITKASATFEPKPEATVHFEVPEGSKVECLKTVGQWIKVKRFDGKLGWILKEKLEKVVL